MADTTPQSGGGDYATDLDALTKRALRDVSGGGADYSGNISDLVGRLKKTDAEEDADPQIQKLRSRVGKDADETERKRLAVEPLDVQPWDAKKEMTSRSTDPVTAFGSFGSVLGVLASAFTHTPMENAFNAAAASMTAIRKGDVDSYNQAYDAWKQNTQLALDRHKVQHEAFEDAMSQLTTDATAMKVYAAKYGDQRARLLAEAGLYKDLSSLGQARQSAAIQLLQVVPDLEKKGAQYKGWLEDPDRTSQDPAKRLAAWQKWFVPPSSRPQSAFAIALDAEQNRRREAGEPAMTAQEIAQLNADVTKGESSTVAARKDREVSLKEKKEEDWKAFSGGKLDQGRQKIADSEQFHRDFMDAKRRGQEDSEAFHSAMEKHWDDQIKVAQQRVAALPANMRAQAINQIISKREADEQRDLTGEEKLAIINQSAMPDDKKVDETAKLIANYKLAPISSAYGLSKPFGQAVMAKVMELNPDYDGTKYNEKNRAVVAFGSGPQGNAVRSFNVAIEHLNTLDQLIDGLRSKDVKTINRVGNFLKEEFGDVAPNDFNAAKDIVGQEVTKAIVGQAGTGAERQGLADKFNAAKTEDQLKDVIGTVKKLMAGQLKGLKKQYETTTKLTDFDDSLLPGTIAEINRASSTGGNTSGWSVTKVN